MLGLCALVLLALAPQAWASSACPSLLNHTFPRLQDDVPQPLCQYQGSVILVVNTASYCGFTSQYEGLEKLYARYKDRGLVVLGFPSNDFGNQEPGSNKEIAEFCNNTFGVKFPMLAKTSVKGSNANPLFKQLAKQSESPGWNFHKYIIDRDGKLLRSFSSLVGPSDRRLITEIERALSAPRS
ncbi:MAG: glutathione peroxidase [Burkholderiaceae bacterium]|nr:glutathione peroxidase [Burkholderiaceae bacterium]